MSDHPPRASAAISWNTRLLIVAGALDFGTVVTYVALAVSGDPLPPNPVNSIVFLALATTTLGLVCARFFWALRSGQERLAAQLRSHIDVTVAGTAVRMDDRLRRITTGMRGAGIALETTGEITMPRAVGRACPHIPPDNVLAFELGRETERTNRGRRG